MSSTEAGRRAEQAAKLYLEMRGYKVLELNYHRSRCEIDIVAKKHDVVSFVEVRYRHGDDQSGGLEYMTASKLKQMRYAAETWLDDYKWSGEYQLATVEVGGPNFVVMHFVDNIL